MKKKLIFTLSVFASAIVLVTAVIFSYGSTSSSQTEVKIYFLGFTNNSLEQRQVQFSISNAGPNTVHIIGTEFVGSNWSELFTGDGPELSKGSISSGQLPAPNANGSWQIVIGYTELDWRHKIHFFAAKHRLANLFPISWATLKATTNATAFVLGEPFDRLQSQSILDFRPQSPNF